MPGTLDQTRAAENARECRFGDCNRDSGCVTVSVHGSVPQLEIAVFELGTMFYKGTRKCISVFGVLGRASTAMAISRLYVYILIHAYIHAWTSPLHWGVGVGGNGEDASPHFPR